MSAVSPLSTLDDDPSRAVEVREPVEVDEEAEAEANEIRDAMAKLQRLVSPTPLLDAEVDSRRADAERLTEASIAAHGGRAYKSLYHDAHQTTLVAAAAALTRALGDGPAGSGFMSDVAEAEHLVRDATHMIANAAREALRRDQGELPRLYDICVKLRRDRDEARAATRRLVLAFGREKREKASRDRRELLDAVAEARDEAVREYAEDKAEVLNRQRAHEEELALLHMQLREAREAPARRIQTLEHQLASERAARGRDFEANASAVAALNDRAAFAEARAADLRNQLGSAKHDSSRVLIRSSEALERETTRARRAGERAPRRAARRSPPQGAAPRRARRSGCGGCASPRTPRRARAPRGGGADRPRGAERVRGPARAHAASVRPGGVTREQARGGGGGGGHRPRAPRRRADEKERER